MTTWVFRSTDTGLPAAGVTGVVGSLITNVLDPCLVNGFNTQTGVSAARTTTTVTYTKASHSYPNTPGTVVTVSGFTEPNFNRTGTILNVTANTFDMICSDTGAASEGTNGTAVRTSLGWAKTTGTTNQASYRPAAGNRFYFAVDDNTAAQNARIRAFETITTGGTTSTNGTNPTPSEGQLAGGLYQYKSSTADSTLRPWVLVSNGKIFYLFVQYSSSTTTGNGLIFGDFTSYKNADTYNTLLIGDNAASSITSSIRISNIASTITTNNGHYAVRSYTQIGTSAAAGKITNGTFTNNVTECGAGAFTYPTGTEGGILMAPLWIVESTASGVRGHLPGLWNLCHSRPLSHGDTFSGTVGTSMAGKTFEVFNTGSGAQMCFETSDTWDQ